MLLHFENNSKPPHPPLQSTEPGTVGNTPAQAFGRAAGLWSAAIGQHQYPDGEIGLKLPPNLPAEVVIYCSLHQPNDKLIALMLAARTARALGAKHLTLVAPYLAYMRQDMAFTPGEVVSQQVIGHFLAEMFDALITVDPHLHRVTRLQDAVPVRQVQVLSAATLLADWVAAQLKQPLLLGPDEESWQWVSRAAAKHHFDFEVCTKLRRGDHHVQITLPELDFQGREVVLMDDMCSTGNTLAQAARLVKAAGASKVCVAVTHALMAGQAMALLKDAGVEAVWSSNSIVHESNVLSLAPLLTQGLRQIYKPA